MNYIIIIGVGTGIINHSLQPSPPPTKESFLHLWTAQYLFLIFIDLNYLTKYILKSCKDKIMYLVRTDGLDHSTVVNKVEIVLPIDRPNRYSK